VSATQATGDVDDDTYEARLQAFVGLSAGDPTAGPDEVNQAMIRHWVEAMGDENPVYTDAEAARANGFPGVIAPPTMLQSWIMRGYKATAELAAARAEGRTGESTHPSDDLMHVLDEGGFTSVVATNCEQEYFRPVVLGDHLSVASSIESVSPEKHTALGIGHFITTLLSFTDQRGEPVAAMRFRILKFRPGTGKAPS
jgi:3-oxo-4,17-pregnadiene-20-carboxyl-CoA hydratase alpha subunit